MVLHFLLDFLISALKYFTQINFLLRLFAIREKKKRRANIILRIKCNCTAGVRQPPGKPARYPSGHVLLEVFHCSHWQQDPRAQNSIAGKTAVLKHGLVWKRRTATSEVRNRIYILWHSQMLRSKRRQCLLVLI